MTGKKICRITLIHEALCKQQCSRQAAPSHGSVYHGVLPPTECRWSAVHVFDAGPIARKILRSVGANDWENQTVLSDHKYIFLKYIQSYVSPIFRFFFKFNRFVTLSENVRAGTKKSPIFRCFLLAVTWFFDFFQILQKNSELDTYRHVRADFHVNRSGDSFN